MQSLTQLLPRWTAEAAEPLPPQPAELVRKVFARLGSLATGDVVSLYGALGGMRMMDNEYWRLWSLSEIEEQTPSEFGVLFSDYCISCWEYRLRPVSSNHSAVYVDYFDGSPPTLVAATLEEFFERYTTSARALLDEGSIRTEVAAQRVAAADVKAQMQPLSYRERTGRKPDFRVRYRFLSQAEGGRSELPFQHIRSDFLYAEDGPSEDGIWCIWPEFVSSDGTVFPEDQSVPAEGIADMYILNAELRPEHRRRVHTGTKGFFVEGARRTASCEVVEVLGLRDAEL